jgi:hypothetical protein
MKMIKQFEQVVTTPHVDMADLYFGLQRIVAPTSIARISIVYDVVLIWNMLMVYNMGSQQVRPQT